MSAFQLVLALGLSGDIAPAKPPPPPLDRIVAVVGKEPILLSQAKRRAAPHFFRIDTLGGDEAKRNASKATVLREVVERMIDEHIERREADKSSITVTASEIDAGIQQIISQSKTNQTDLFAEVKRQGMTEAEYKEEIGRQVLEGKLLQLRVRPRVKVGEPEARAAYASWLKEQTGTSAPLDLRILVLKVARDGSDKQAVEKKANQLATQAKAANADFCALIAKNSDDPTTKSTCGSKGPMPKGLFFPEIAKAVDPLKPGEFAAPFFIKDPAGDQAYLIIQRAPGTGAPPSFDSVKDRMKDRAYLEATERERKQWLADLRKATYIEVRL